MPLPLALMIPFMGIQSAVMAKQFGENFQYGKRRISAMDNKEFNALTPKKLQENANAELKAMIPSMQQSLTDMREFQVFVIKEFLLTVRAVIDAGLGKILGLNPTEINETVQNIEHFLHGHFESHATIPPSETPPTTPPTPPSGDDLVHLTLAEVNALSDNQLSHWHNNQNLLSTNTQLLVIQEWERRNRTSPEQPTQPTPPQQNTRLDPAFVASLTKQDLDTGGARVRNYKGTLQKWKGTHKLIWELNVTTKPLIVKTWSGSKFTGGSAGGFPTQAQVTTKINQIKTQAGSSYVLFFRTATRHFFYLISDNF